jgi:uncharacterized protein (TIGR03437 family)
VNGASFQTPIAPGSFVTIYGQKFIDREAWWDSAITDGKTLPSSLAGIKVRVNGKDCFVNYVSPTQINALTPPDEATGTVPVEVVASSGSASSSVTMMPSAPGFFTYSLGGKRYVAAQFANTAICVAPAGALAGATSRPAKPGDYLQLYATGLGRTNPPYPVGQVLAAPYPVEDLADVRITIGGVDAPVQFAGMTFAGVFQVNIQVPENVPDGEVPVVLQLNGQSSQANAVLVFAR